MSRFDLDSNIIWWASEETTIPYVSPVDNRIHRYYVDFTVKVKTTEGKEKILLIEVKPLDQTKEPRKQLDNKKPSKKYITEVLTYGVNKAKWEAAKSFCEEKGFSFVVLTEKEIFNKGN